jgi:hypothetical protein
MKNSGICVLVALVVSGGCGGSYSNEDVDFQNALPARQELAPQLSAVVVADSAEYYVVTRQVVGLFSEMLDFMLGVVEEVRAFPPSRRDGDTRMWGPFDKEDDPSWRWRIVIAREAVVPGRIPLCVSTFPFEFRYVVQFASQSAPGLWLTLIEGAFAPSGGVRRGCGRVILSTTEARRVGFPLRDETDPADKGLTELLTLTIDYDTRAVPTTVNAQVVNVPEADSSRADYTYIQREDRSGEMTFDFDVNRDLYAQAVKVTSRWRDDAAGRADFVVTAGLAAGLAGTDCWDATTRATFVQRAWEPEQNRGDPATCPFPAPP